MRILAVLAAVGATACLPLACHLISGVGDLQFPDTVSAQGGEGAWGMGGYAGAGGTGGATTSSSTTSQGGSGAGATGGSAGTGGQGGPPPPPPPCSDLQDACDGATVDYGLWAEHMDYALTGAGSGYYFVRPDPLVSGAHGSIRTVTFYDMQACTVVVQVPQATNAQGDTMTTVSVRSSASYQDSFGFRISGGQLVSRVTVANVETEAVPVTYDPWAHLWLRLREDGMVHFETSSDGYSWTQQHETATPSYINSVSISLGASAQDGTATDPGEAHFDTVNLPPQ
jgi:hypothetical protein